ncbi:MAG: hypothetical protein VKO39_06280 [Cyanobacteriota bacterium]|nr:hypothetical protein [Cyanobacteriota bacterium]
MTRPQRTMSLLATAALLLTAATVLVFNNQHSGHPVKVRRELRKF